MSVGDGREQVDLKSSVTLTRRGFLIAGVSAALGWLSGNNQALTQLVLKPIGRPHGNDVLICLFLRGGADGLNILIPYADNAYYQARPSLAIPSPNDRRRSASERAILLNDFFALHPALKPLYPLYAEGKISFVHACGSHERSRSHFEAMSAMERGVAEAKEGIGSGWIARHLLSAPHRDTSPLRAVAISNVLPVSLRGMTDAVALQTITDFQLATVPRVTLGRGGDLRDAFRELYRAGKHDGLTEAAHETLQVLDTLQRVDPQRYRPAHGAEYPDTELGRALKQVACLIRANTGLEVACIDKGGWDTHVAQGSTGGWMAANLTDLARSIAAFTRDTGTEMRRITLVVLTEFGRRVRENSGLGTDHGRASVLFLVGGGASGRIIARWPGLAPHQLEEPGDLRVTTDYRDVLAEIVTKRLGNPHVARVFPGYTARKVGAVG